MQSSYWGIYLFRTKKYAESQLWWHSEPRCSLEKPVTLLVLTSHCIHNICWQTSPSADRSSELLLVNESFREITSTLTRNLDLENPLGLRIDTWFLWNSYRKRVSDHFAKSIKPSHDTSNHEIFWIKTTRFLFSFRKNKWVRIFPTVLYKFHIP